MRAAVWAWTAAAFVGLAVSPAASANPPPGLHILSGKAVEPDDIRLVAEFLATTDGSAPTGSIVDEALDLIRRNPGVDYKDLAAELARRHQNLTAPDKFDALMDQFQGLQKLAGPLGQMMQLPAASDVSSPSRPDDAASQGNPAQQAPGSTVRQRPSPLETPRTAGPGTAPSEPSANPPKAATAGLGPKPDRASAEPKVKPLQADPPAKAPDRPNPLQAGGRFEGGSGRRRMSEQAWEPPSFFDNITTEGDMWQAREQRAQAEAENRSKRQRQFDAVQGFWESNIGSLNETPAVKELLHEMFAGPNPIAPNAAEGLLALLGDPSADPRGLLQWANSQGELFESVSRVNPFSRRLGGLNFSGFDANPAAGGALNYQPGAIAAEGSWLPVVLFIAVAGGSLVAWRFWPRGTATTLERLPAQGLGPWPIDPRKVASRSDLIKAFEYLSVLLCGSQARAAHHLAVAEALRKAAGSGDAAEPLARGYALARYTPATEPLPPGTIAEARGHLCRLAGVATP